MKSLKSLTPLRRPTSRSRRKRPTSKPYSARSVLIVLVLASFSFAGVAALAKAAAGDSAAGSSFYKSFSTFLSGQINGSPPRRMSLSKEYVYSDSRLLAVEDAGASQASPSDLAVFRPETGQWWVLGGFSQQITGHQWGASGDIPTLGDFDGDGKTDLAILRPSDSTWWVLQSRTGSFQTIPFGSRGDVPVPGDYDGDGLSDIAVFRPSNGVWYAMLSREGNSVAVPFGSSADTPAPADYDGDGITDPAIWRATSGVFEWLQSSNGLIGSARFSAGGEAVPADYDGDGRADPAVRDGLLWTIKLTLSGDETTIEWPAGDVAVQNDYDGDGRADVAVWRSDGGIWLIRNSSDGSARTAVLGERGDIPVPAYYRR